MCDFSLRFFRINFLILSLSVAGCSSTPVDENSETPPVDEVTDTRADEVQDIEDPLADSATGADLGPEAGGPDPDEIEVVLKEPGPDPAMVGLLRFFSSLDRGIVVFDIDWSSPCFRA